MKELIELLKAQNLTIASCESFTAGLFCAELASVPGASAVLKGGIVTYATSIKMSVAHVDPNIIQRYGVISRECAAEMASKTREVMDVDICVSFTGNAGPAAMEGKPAGEVYGAIATCDQVQTYRFLIQEERNQLRETAITYMCEKIKSIIRT